MSVLKSLVGHESIVVHAIQKNKDEIGNDSKTFTHESLCSCRLVCVCMRERVLVELLPKCEPVAVSIEVREHATMLNYGVGCDGNSIQSCKLFNSFFLISPVLVHFSNCPLSLAF